jgi:hypothetical protein
MQNSMLFVVSARTPPDSEVPLWMDSEPFPAGCTETHELNVVWYICEISIRPVHGSKFGESMGSHKSLLTL